MNKTELILKINGLPDNKEYDIFTLNSKLVISDNNIKNIITNNNNIINIQLKYIGFFKKIKYIITFNQKGTGCIQIKLKNGQLRLFGLYIDNYELINRIKIGSMSEINNFSNYWNIDFKYQKKYVDNVYTYVRDNWKNNPNDIHSFIHKSLNFGFECQFIYKYFDRNYNNTIQKLNNLNYINNYINDFKNFIDILNCYKDYKFIIIFEPYLLSNLYKYHLEPEKINVNEITLIDFIKKIKSIFELNSNIELVYVVTSNIFIDILNSTENILDNIINYICIFYEKCGILQSNYLAFNKCEIDENSSTIIWDNNIWKNYFYIIKGILDKLKLKGILYELPVGHPNNLLEISPYTNNIFDNHLNINGDLEDNTSIYLFGGIYKDSDGKTIILKENIKLLYNYGIRYILFGPSSYKSTTNIPLKYTGDICTDHYYTISKIQDYLSKYN